MQPNFEELRLLTPHDTNFTQIQNICPLNPYSDQIVDFLDAWAKKLLANPESRMYPDVVTFAFWIRKGNISKYKKEFLQTHSDDFRLGKGVVFHIAPSNVPINFAYSLAIGLLSGNANIVKVSSKDFRQVTILSNELETLLQNDEWKDMHDFITLLRYDRSNKAWTDFLSSICDTRIIWGGDQTIEEVRKSHIPARSFDICFADRYSLCVIHADKLMEEKNINAVARGFYNDTYLFNQNACTAPHLIIWIGTPENLGKAKDLFWGAVSSIVGKEYLLAPVTAVDKFTTFCSAAIRNEGLRRESTPTNTIVRVHLEKLPKDISEYKSVGGYFNEFDAVSLQEIVSIVTRKFQTLSYYGFEKSELQSFILEQRLVGVDRCVPIGNTLDFEPVWDGWDLITTLSRQIN
jgi:hypothetical protein